MRSTPTPTSLPEFSHTPLSLTVRFGSMLFLQHNAARLCDNAIQRKSENHKEGLVTLPSLPPAHERIVSSCELP